MKVFIFFALIVSSVGTYAYTQSDVADANYLAEKGFIVSRSDSSDYDLDRNVFRQEIIGVALKMKGVTLPVLYGCRNYFSDVSLSVPNSWACRAIELAADQDLVTRANSTFRPEDSITFAESAAILMKALGMSKSQSVDSYVFAPGTADWQKPYIVALFEQNIISSTSSFAPNVPATRAQVFTLAANINRALHPEYVPFSERSKTAGGEFFKKKPTSYTRKTSKKSPTYLKYKNR